MNRYLPSEGSILEIGAATGRYTLELAKRGYRLTAVDVSEKLLECCRQRIAEAGLAGQVRFVLADARDLTPVGSEPFDGVLLMGPLYHLVVAGVEPAISADDESYNRLQGQQRQLWLDLLDEVSTEASLIGASRHLLYIGKK